MNCPQCNCILTSLRHGCPNCGMSATSATGRLYVPPVIQNPAQKYAATTTMPNLLPDFEIYSLDDQGKAHPVAILNVEEIFDTMANKTVYVIRIESPFILTEKDVKTRMGIGFKVLSVDGKEQLPEVPRELDVDHMTEAIIREGYRALAKICHPDRNGNPEAMIALNKTKKELVELLTKLGGNLNI